MKKVYCLVFLSTCLLFFVGNNASAQETQNINNQIRLLLQEKQSRTPAQRKISSQLLQAVREKRGKKMVDGLMLNKVDVNADAAGLLSVDIRAIVTDSLLSAIKKMGGKIIFASKKYNAIRAKINLLDVESIATSESVQFIGPAIQAFSVGSNNIYTANNSLKPSPKVENNKLARRHTMLKERLKKIQTELERYLNTGSVNSQGDHAHKADDVRTTYGAQGQGIKIGVLSDSYNAKGGATADVYNGNLPGTGNPLGYTMPVTVVADYAGGDDEGRAMLQIVHDLAPKAQLFFASASISEASFATNIIALRNNYNCDVIIDDVFYTDEPAFQDGTVAQAVNTITASGALYFSSAGNEGSVTKGTAGIWEGDFKDAGSLAFQDSTSSGKKAGSIHNWGTVTMPVNGNIITQAGNFYTLTWSDPFNASTNDYDLFLISSTGTVKAYSTDIQNGTQQAIEGFNTQTLALGDRLVVFKDSNAQIRAFSLNTLRGRLTNSTSGQTHGHSAVSDAFSVAAASALQTSGSPFSTGNIAETFTSDGLRRIFYNADGSPITPGNLLFATNGGVVRRKPDITAADGVSTSLPLNLGLNPFYGTSAAAPHAGAIAALIKSIQPTITPIQMRSFLTSTALDIESAGYDNVSGYGIVQAYQAMQSSTPPLVADVSLVSFTTVEVAGDNGSGAVDPGERINLVVKLKNTSPATASSVIGTLTSTTTGVTITTSTSTYGSMAAAASMDNPTAPFVFTVANSVPCGTQLNFMLTLNFGNGVTSPQSFPLVVTVGNQPIINIAGALGTPAATTSKFISSTGTQTGRIARNGIVSVCGTAKIAPLLNATTGSRIYDGYIFTNTTNIKQCINVTFSSTSNSVNNNTVSPLLYCVAYNNSGFVPATPNINFAADSGGVSAFSTSYAFNVNAGDNYTIVVHEINPSTAAGASYYLNINGNGCSNVVLPVTWLSFTAVEKSGQTALEWKVTNEVNANKYEVEYSIDGSHFIKIYTLPAQTSTTSEKTYDQMHSFPEQGNNYYRIREVDKDGQFMYSKIALVVFDKVNDIIIAPTIATSFIKIQSKKIIDGIRIYNSVGQLIMNIAPSSGSYNLPINNLPAGPYFLQIITADKTFEQKIIKE